MIRDLRVLFTAAPGVMLWPGGAVQVEHTVPQVSIYTLAAVIEDTGFPCTVIDPVDYWRRYRTPDELASACLGHDVVCVSANSSTWPLAGSLIARFDALQPRPLIVVGGLHATYLDRYVLDTTAADIVVRGEGEVTLAELLRTIARSGDVREVAGLTFRHDGQVVRTDDRSPLHCDQLSQQPLPRWDKLPPQAYGFIPIEVSRGCRYCCAFCSIGHKKLWRPVEAETIRRRVFHSAQYLANVRYRTLMFADDCFTSDIGHVRTTCEAIHDLAPDVGVAVEARAGDVLDREMLELLGGVNLEFIQIGVECGYPEGLRRVHKGISIDQAVASAHALHLAGLRTQAKYSYIVGFPWEGMKEMQRTLSFAMHLASRYGNHVQVAWHMVVPGSELYDELAAAGCVSPRDFDVFPHERPDLFERTHPSVTAIDTARLHDYASLLEQSFPWVVTLGNVFRQWSQHSHLPIDRTLPVTVPVEHRDPVAVGETVWDNLPPVLRRSNGRRI